MRYNTFVFVIIILTLVLFLSGCGGSEGCPGKDPGNDGDPNTEIHYAKETYNQPPPPPPDPCKDKSGVDVEIGMAVEHSAESSANRFKCSMNLFNCETNLTYSFYFKSPSKGYIRYIGDSKEYKVPYRSKSILSGTWGWTVYKDYECFLELRDASTGTLLSDTPSIYYCDNTTCKKCNTYVNGVPSSCTDIGNPLAPKEEQETQQTSS